MYNAKEQWNSPEWVEDWLSRPQNNDDSITAEQFLKLPRIVQDRAKDKSYKVIELGSGTGRWSQYFANYVGLDVSEELLKVAREKYPHDPTAFQECDFSQYVKGTVPLGYYLDGPTGPITPPDLIFSWCGLLQINEEDFAKLKLPKCDYLFVEPAKQLEIPHSHVHDYESKFGVKPVGEIGNLTIFTNVEI